MNFKRVICDGCKNVPTLEEHNCYHFYSVINGERTIFVCECRQCLASSEPANNMPAQLEALFTKFGSSMMSDDFCSKLLAFVHHFNTELVVLHKGLNAGVMIAQEKANLKGGCVPDAVIIREFNKRRRELEAAEQAYRLLKGNTSGDAEFYAEHVPWLQEIYDRYDLVNYYKAKSF